MYREADIIKLCANLTDSRLDRWVQEGWITPKSEKTQAVYNDLDVGRADLICYLLDELEIQDEAIPVILSLLDQVYSLRGELKTVGLAIGDQPKEIRSQISITIQNYKNKTS
ncbi:MAG: chaperone modulator CbpM [Rhodospirillaceae bacterium]